MHLHADLLIKLYFIFFHMIFRSYQVYNTYVEPIILSKNGESSEKISDKQNVAFSMLEPAALKILMFKSKRFE